MERRSFIRNTGLTIGALALLNQNTLAEFLSDQTYNIRMLTDNIGIFTEKGGTILFMLSKEGTVVVDSQFPDSAQHLIDEIKKKTDKPFRLLINTHHHSDHTAGNIAFKDLTKNVLAHENSKINQQAVAVKNKNEDKQLYPNQTFGTVSREKIDKEEISLYYYGAGHTNGDAFVHFKKANIVHVGDLVFNRKHPYVDRSAGASITSWIAVLDKATGTFEDNTTFISGHAGDGYDVILKKADLIAFRDYLSNVLKFTKEQIQEGKTVDEIVKATEIPGSPEWKGEGIDRPLKAAFEELNNG